jgi:hypothetical protein
LCGVDGALKKGQTCCFGGATDVSQNSTVKAALSTLLRLFGLRGTSSEPFNDWATATFLSRERGQRARVRVSFSLDDVGDSVVLISKSADTIHVFGLSGIQDSSPTIESIESTSSGIDLSGSFGSTSKDRING